MTIDVITSTKDKRVYVYMDGNFVLKDEYRSPKHFMEVLCLGNGTTLDGCYEASRILLDNAYKRPIYIGGSCNQIFIPISSFKDSHCTWISLDFFLNESLDTFNALGYEIMSKKRWQKHLSDGIALKHAIFKKETF